MDITGEIVKLKKGKAILIEDALGRSEMLKRIIDGIIQGASDMYRNEREAWSVALEEAKKQFPEFNEELHALTYDWIKKACIIIKKPQRY